MKHKNTQKLTLAAMTAAAYAALSLLGAVFGLTFGPIQVRFSEALCLLPFLFPETAWGLGVGCLIANLFSPYGALDIVVGSLSTLIAALLTARCQKKWLAPLPPVVLNTLLVGAVIAYEETGLTAAFPINPLPLPFEQVRVSCRENLSAAVENLIRFYCSAAR